jgi:DNA repair exonuclease SbcCD ATPase subunit
MINSIELTNFQSHKNSKLEFHPGINAIIGSSDSGKSAIMRALNWAVYNRPSGDAFVSYWAKNEKGKQTEQCEVSVEKNDKLLMRIKSGNFNGYWIDKKELNAIGTDVPEDVNKFFNLSEVNIQKQLDAPFLLSNTSGEVARFFNKIIKLDTIDQALSSIEKRKRANRDQLKSLTEELEKQEKLLGTFGWIEKVEPLIIKIEGIEKKWNEYQDKITRLTDWKEEFESLECKAKEANKLIKLEDRVDKIIKINKEIDEKDNIIMKLEECQSEYSDYKQDINTFNLLIKKEIPVERALKLQEKIMRINTDKGELISFKQKYVEISEKICIINTEIEKLNESMPEVCPLCDGSGRLK